MKHELEDTIYFQHKKIYDSKIQNFRKTKIKIIKWQREFVYEKDFEMFQFSGSGHITSGRMQKICVEKILMTL